MFRRHVLVCTKQGEGRCGDKGGMELFTCFRAANRGQDDVLVTQCGCTGQHDCGPTVIVYPEGIWYRGVTPGDVDEILTSARVERLVNPDVGCGPCRS